MGGSGAFIEIDGYEYSDCDGCTCSGLGLTCTSTDTESKWNGFTSDLVHWKAAGSDDGQSFPALSGVCQSTSGFALNNGETYTKIWPSGGEMYARFEGSPYLGGKVYCVLDLTSAE